MKIAIIGTGISGLGAAWLLQKQHDVTVFEKDGRIGGHTRTIHVSAPGPVGGQDTTPLPVDTGFIVFNDRNYPNLTGLFGQLDVPVQKSDMSFGVSIADGWLEYASGGMFAQRANLVRPRFWQMLADILRFNRRAVEYIDRGDDMTLGQCLDELDMGDWFRRYYLLAMGAAIWSAPVDTIMQFPARTFLRFFHNHGLLTVNDHPQWYTVTGGSAEYVKRLTAPFADRIRRSAGLRGVIGEDNGAVIVHQDGETERFDQVIFACHADEALALIRNPSDDIRSTLGAFGFQKNSIVVHADTSFMPRRRQCWASWVYLSEQRQDHQPAVSLSYWMNNLQGLDPDRPVFVTLNPGREPDAELVLDRHEFSHPVFDQAAVRAQAEIPGIQGQAHMWFCGAWQRYGFHEDGLLSAVNVARSLGVAIPWQ